jgi:class 3 adenylate cyclase/pimeloyl-ACP methyl ester carboxylesterase
MQPEVRYCTTADGIRIAYAIAGSGPPLLYGVEPISSHMQLEWSHSGSGRILRRHAQHNTLIRLDFRGSGLSDRVIPQSLDEGVLDVEAVVERAGFEQFALYANLSSVPLMILYAARHPERVTRMVIVDGYVRYADILNTPQAQALRAAARIDWALAMEAIAFATYGSDRDENREHGKFVRACVGPEYFDESNLDLAMTWDVTEAARQIKAPTLVMRHDGLQFTTMEMAKELVTLIPDAQLAVIEGTWSDNVEAMVDRAVAFINPGSEANAPVREPMRVPSGTAVILFADIADSTALTERLGDAAFRAKARELDGGLRTVIRDRSGAAIEGKLLGDGVLAVFTSARQAIEAALACGRSGDEAGLPLHLGLHAGDVIREEGNVFGGAVNIAARVSALAAPGEVLVSDIVRGLARTSAGVQFEDRGEREMKGVGEPVRVWAVRAIE